MILLSICMAGGALSAAGGGGGGGGGGTLQWTHAYLYINNTSGAGVNGNGQGYIGTNNYAAQNTSTEIYVTYDGHGTDLGSVTTGNMIRYELASDATKYIEFTITSVTDHGTYYTYGVTVSASSGAAPFASFNNVNVMYYA
jgi:hypothetical protein